MNSMAKFFMMITHLAQHIYQNIFKETEDGNNKITEDGKQKITEDSDY